MTLRHAQRQSEHGRGAILGLDIRDDALAAIVVDEGGTIRARQRRAGATPAAAADLVSSLPRPVSMIGAAVTDPDAPFVAEIVASAAAAVAVARDPRLVTYGSAVALAEQWLGVARDCPFVAALAIADVAQAGLVIHGNIYEGAHGRACDVAWLALNPVEREDYRRNGCLDTEVGAAGIVKRLVWRIKAGDHSRVEEMTGNDLSAITVSHVLAAARDGDGVAISIVRDTARYVGMAIANLAAILDPDVVVLSGLVADAADLLLDPSRVEALRHLSADMGAKLRIGVSELGEEAVAIGAARAAMLAP